MNKKTTIVNFILDKSGSMESVRSSTISGFNEYIGTLKKDKKSSYEFTLTLFDTEVKSEKSLPIKEVQELTKDTYNPNGNTALYDAVCKTIKETKDKKDQKVITIIMTDGQENSSKEYTQIQMKTIIKEREEKGNWTFVYLGANQDSYAVAQQYGIPQMNVSNFNATSAGVGATMRSMANNTTMYASAATSNTKNFFSSKDQDDLNKIK